MLQTLTVPHMHTRHTGRASPAQTDALCKVARQASAAGGKPASVRVDEQQTECSKATVYGSYAAVQMADAVMLHRLAGLLSPLMTGYMTHLV